ncbi:hypothetical protein D3C72_1946900 [compost metagenome]
MAKENSPCPMAARCCGRVMASFPPVALTTRASTAAAMAKRSTTDTTGSTAPSWKVMAYQVVPHIRAQTPIPPMARAAGDSGAFTDWVTGRASGRLDGNETGTPLSSVFVQRRHDLAAFCLHGAFC